MLVEERTAGTPDPDDGDPGDDTQDSGTQDQKDRDADSREPDYKKLYLEEAKPKIERVNALEKENAELKEAMKQSPAASDDDEDSDPKDPAHWQRVKHFAAQGDVACQALLEEREQRKRDQETRDRETIHALQLRDIEDKPLRKRVYDHFQKNRHRLGDTRAALAEVREQELEQDNKRLREQIDKRPDQSDRDKPPKTHDRTPPEGKKKVHMTQKEWDQEQKTLSPLDRMLRQKDYNLGKIVVED